MSVAGLKNVDFEDKTKSKIKRTNKSLAIFCADFKEFS
jgi:hypothetical protein